MVSSAPRSDLATAAELLTGATPRSQERRRFRRVPIVVNGRFLDADGREHDCRSADLSPGDARIAAPIEPGVGNAIVIYLEGFGRIAARVARRCGESEFAVTFETSLGKRERIAETLMWLLHRDSLAPQDAPAPRAPAHNRPTVGVVLDDGVVLEGEVLDVSLAGLTVRTLAPAPHLGAWVRVGAVYGRVARASEDSFSVDFEPRPNRA